ncbi:golgin subfamily A member 6-like protein 26 [Engraulis encrasicolus]|uniref:golgin subfamily A member 6-like protein 26 n=1 Tax=Engraulis encrasicolus TaxID=184585 RepID=UPI002FD3A740
MARELPDKKFELAPNEQPLLCSPGDDVTIPCRLSPATSVVAMEIRWFRNTDCVYLYRNGHAADGVGFEGRVSVDPVALQTGDMSLVLKGAWETDAGWFLCQVLHGQHVKEARIGFLYPRGRGSGRPGEKDCSRAAHRAISDGERERMEQSVHSLHIRLCDAVMAKLSVMEQQMKETGQELDVTKRLLQNTDIEVETMRRREQERQTELEMSSEVETTKRQLESLGKELMDKNSQLQELRTQLMDKEREMEERQRQMEEREMGTDVGLPHRRRRWSRDKPPCMGGESPGLVHLVSPPAVSELRLVLLGRSAAGKRAAGNTILGTGELWRQASTQTSTESQHSESSQGEVAGRQVTVVDTPDWFCIELSEKDTRQDVGLCVRLSAPGPHAFLLVVSVEPSEGEERRMLEKMEDILGEGCWRHTLILFTQAEGLEQRSLEDLLQTENQELQRLLDKCGNRCHLLNISDRPEDTEITQLLEKIVEMVSGNRETFYSCETYQEAERQVREIERRIQRKREIKFMEQRLETSRDTDRSKQTSLPMMEGRVGVEEKKGEEGGCDDERREEDRGEYQKGEEEEEEEEESRMRESFESNWRGPRERGKTDDDEEERGGNMTRGYERDEEETGLMEIIHTELWRFCWEKSERETERVRQMEEEVTRVRQEEVERMRQAVADREIEVERMSEAIKRLSTSLLTVMSADGQLGER